MSDRWSPGLLFAALVCCAGPVLISTGLAGAAWGVVRQHWWLAAGLGLAALTLVARAQRVRER